MERDLWVQVLSEGRVISQEHFSVLLLLSLSGSELTSLDVEGNTSKMHHWDLRILQNGKHLMRTLRTLIVFALVTLVAH